MKQDINLIHRETVKDFEYWYSRAKYHIIPDESEFSNDKVLELTSLFDYFSCSPCSRIYYDKTNKVYPIECKSIGYNSFDEMLSFINKLKTNCIPKALKLVLHALEFYPEHMIKEFIEMGEENREIFVNQVRQKFISNNENGFEWERYSRLNKLIERRGHLEGDYFNLRFGILTEKDISSPWGTPLDPKDLKDEKYFWQ